jgi:hypothetical protein
MLDYPARADSMVGDGLTGCIVCSRAIGVSMVSVDAKGEKTEVARGENDVSFPGAVWGPYWGAGAEKKRDVSGGKLK